MKTYEFNISFKGQHFIFVGSRNSIDADQAKNLLFVLKEKFKAEDGYSVTCTVTETICTSLK